MAEEYGSAKLVDEALKKRNKAQVARSFVKSANGVHIIQGIQEEITTLLREITDKRLSHEEYLEKRAEVACLRRLLQGWMTEAENVDRYEKMYKQRSEENARRIELEQKSKA